VGENAVALGQCALTRPWSGPGRRVRFLSVESRACAGPAAQRPYVMPLKAPLRVQRHEEGSVERPFRWSDVWWIFLPLYPWIAIALLIYSVVRLLW
jgi:hypothetical protein